MKATPFVPADLSASVLSVPPLPRQADGTICRQQTVRLNSYLRRGGVSTFMYGGNANLYNMAPSEFMSFVGASYQMRCGDRPPSDNRRPRRSGRSTAQRNQKK